MTETPEVQDFAEFEQGVEAELKAAPRSKFGILQWADQEKRSGKSYEWQVYGLLPMNQTILWFGESQSGKSFSAFDAAVHIASGMPYQGKRTTQGGVVYAFVEKGHGAINRMAAFRQVHDLPLNLPLAALTKRFDIFSEEQTIRDLADEAKLAAEKWDVPLSVIVIDTHDKASPGASELDKKDVSTLVRRYEMLRDLTGAAIWVIGHSNAFGGTRGSLVLYNAIETVIHISPMAGPDKLPFRDANGLTIREACVKKQSEGEAGVRWTFTLPAIRVGVNDYGEAITSCVVAKPSKQTGEVISTTGGFTPTINDTIFLNALTAALAAHGGTPPFDLPRSITAVVHYKYVKEAYKNANPDDGDNTEEWLGRLKKQMQRTRERLQRFGVIGVEGHQMWLSGKYGVAKAQAPAQEELPDPMAAAVAEAGEIPF